MSRLMAVGFGSALLLVVGFLAAGSGGPGTLYVCENKASFLMSFQSTSSARVTSRGKPVRIVSRNDAPDIVRTYGDVAYAYTFVDGYDGQVIVTDRSGPYDTMCYPIPLHVGTLSF